MIVDELKKLLENAGIRENEIEGDTMHVEDAHGNTYSVYFDEHDVVTIGKNGSEVAVGEAGGGGVAGTSIQDPGALIEAVIAFAENNQR